MRKQHRSSMGRMSFASNYDGFMVLASFLGRIGSAAKYLNKVCITLRLLGGISLII